MECKYLNHQINIRSDGQYRLCCISLEPNNIENIRTHSPEEWQSSETKQRAIKMLAENQWPDACKKCKDMESIGLQSRRQNSGKFGPGLTHFDLRFGNSCNLKCLSCWEGSSSSIAEEAIEMDKQGIKTTYSILAEPNFNWATEENLKKLENFPFKEIYLTGGEPMMVRHLPTFLERLDKSIKIKFNTNCTIRNPKLEKILKKFNEVMMTLSLDAVDEKINYIRYGSDWKIIEENANRWNDFCTVNISPTISILNAWFLNEIYEYADKKKWEVFQNFLLDPGWLNLKNAPTELKILFHPICKEWSTGEADQFQIELFKKNISRLDNFRGIFIKDYLPPVAKAYGFN